MSSTNREDFDFASEIVAARFQGPPRSALALMVVIAALIAVFLAWAYHAKVDEVTRGEGQVIPSSKTQMVQTLESGILKEIHVKIGEQVKRGQLLLRIDDTGVASSLGEQKAKEISLLAQIHRLRAELLPEPPETLSFPTKIAERSPSAIRAETNLYAARLRSLRNQIGILSERLQQRRQELNEAKSNSTRLENNLKIAREELALKEPLAKRGIVPKTDILQLRREISNTTGQLEGTKRSIPRLEAAIREAQRQNDEQRLTFRQNAQTELNQRMSELSVVHETIKGATDRVVRTDVHSPVDGIVNKINVNTIGSVVKSGETAIEIVPIEDTLLVEAKIKPADIAFIHLNLPAVVKLTAYDFSIYGGLDGVVERISADSTVDQQTRESYYTVTIKTKSTTLDSHNRKKVMPIIPGMVATVDIMTGKKSVLEYILKPIIKAKNEALRER